MSEMFRCPNCKEVIRTGEPVCQYCKSQDDEQAAHAEALKFQAGIGACAAANHIKSLIYAAPVLPLIDLGFVFYGSSNVLFVPPSFPIYASFLPIGSLAGALRWLTKYGGLKTDDPDLPVAKKSVKKALILWTIMSAIHIAILAKTFLAT
jgi:hypothetical protein